MASSPDPAALIALVLGCDAAVAAELSRHGRLHRFDQQARLACQGDALATLWLVLEGRVKVESCSASGRTARLALQGPGEWIGSYAVPATCAGDIVATERTTALAFAAGILPGLADRDARIGGMLAHCFARQLASIVATLDARATLTARGRVFAELLHRAGDGLTIAPPPVIAQLAFAALTTRETASRAVAELERRGIIARSEAQLRIQSPRLLRDLIV